MGKVRWRRLRLDPVLAACFVALFAFPLAASIVAAGQPRDAPSAAATPERAGSRARAAAALRDLPAFSAGSTLERRIEAGGLLSDGRRTRDAVAAALRDLLGESRGAAVLRMATGRDAPAGAFAGHPYRTPRLDALLDGPLRRPLDAPRAQQASDVAALLVLAAAAPDGTSALPFAPLVAFTLLERASAGDLCLPQLNLALVVSGADDAPANAVRQEFARAARLCPGDPTPRWMLGQYLSRRVSVDDRAVTRAAVAVFRVMQRSAASAALGWSGEADTELRLGYEREELLQPFSARAHFDRALRLYRRAQRLARDRGLSAGAARALAGLRRYGEAAAEQRRALRGRASFAPLAVRHVEYLERAHRFADAARAARALIARHELPSGRALIAGEAFGSEPEDRGTPLSIGADRLSPVALIISGRGDAGGGAAVGDLSFIPQFRAGDSLTAHDRWCPAFSLPRDLLLAGDARAALAALPGGDPRGIADAACPDLTEVEAMARLDAGREDDALDLLRDGDLGEGVSDLREMQQNMWRFAGDLGGARAAARAWAARKPGDARAADRLGEVAFLAGDHAAAARAFGRSLRLTRSQVRGWTAQEAYALLKRGTALGVAGRRGEARVLLERADEVASRAEAAARASAGRAAAEPGELGFFDDVSDDAEAVFASYHARVQAGDLLLRAGSYAAAAEAYEAAREREPRLREVDEGALARPEALHNNQAIAEAKLGHHDRAVAAAREALRADPRSPVFLETLAYALRRAGQTPQAERAYRAAVAADPTAYTAWNDLGVVLARQGRLDAAVDAFRRALGVRDEYATAWFNLGVAQSRRGIAHTLAAQGAFGRAFGADGGLRDRERSFIADDAVYFTNLDLSKPLPPQWSYAGSQERAPVAAAGIVLLVLLGLRLGRALLARGFGGNIGGKLMEPVIGLLERFPRLPVYTPMRVAVVATVAVFAVGMLRGGGTAPDEMLVLIAGVLVLTAIVGRGRRLVARQAGVALGQRGWTPGIALAAVVAAFGSAWAPLPVAEPGDPAPGVHWIGPVLSGAAALGLLVLAAWLSIPGTLALASAAIVMTASLLTPTKPLDGGFVATGTAGVAAGLALLGGGLFFLLGVA